MKVQERTRDLTRTRDHLQAEIALHEKTTGELRNVQHELVQANRLSILGQVAAGVAHEINQPVATIRAFADNARTLLKRDRMAEANENLENIAALTDRIGHITGELRAFSRKAGATVGPTDLMEALEGAILLVGPRARRQGVTLQSPPRSHNCRVQANRVRLEQVLVNLLQNGLEALEGTENGRIVIALHDLGDSVQLQVHDNGPGLSDEARARLFTPFHTTKPDGLGLGLVISRDIVAEFGGELRAARAGDASSSSPHAPGSGALFILTLRKAPDQTHRTEHST
jgi:two-component system C4-dicarboxylate transport sensor histidine kinase DctB